MKKIVIDPITRLEGHGKISIFMNDAGNVENAYFQVPELRGFERFCEGRQVEDLARITPKICGVCPGAHHMASTKALDAVFKTEPTIPAKKLRELYYMAHFVHSHIAHFYALAAPDFVLGPTADPAERNILGVIAKVGLDIGKQVIQHRSFAQKIQAIIGGNAIFPSCGLPGGMSRPITEEERKQIEEWAKSEVEFGKFTLKLFHDVVLGNKTYLDVITGSAYYHETYYMGLVDSQNRPNFYDGDIRVVDLEGNEFLKFKPSEYLEHIEEIAQPYTYLKFSFLKAIGWKGLVDGADSGIYRVAPLARLNVAEKMATPLANEAFRIFKETLGHPVHNTLGMHWARVIELLYAAERLLELAQDPEITSNNLRAPLGTPEEGVGVVEAPRGTLIHHYKTDENGITKANGVNLIVATGHNHGAICMSIKKAAESFLNGNGGTYNPEMLNFVEMAFRAYDPCFACATHSLPGQMPLEVEVLDSSKKILWNVSRNT